MDNEYRMEAPNQVWTNELISKMRKQDNVIYHKGVFGIRIIPRISNNPLFILLHEDDGFLSTNHHPFPETFDMYWADDLISVLEDAKGYVKSHPNKFGPIKDN